MFISFQNNNPIEKDVTNIEEVENINEEVENINEEEAKININLDEDKNELNSSETKEIDEDPRRKRRRSSATS